MTDPDPYEEDRAPLWLRIVANLLALLLVLVIVLGAWLGGGHPGW